MVVSARYQIPQGLDPVPAVASALGVVVQDQPMLRVGILAQDTSVATFSHVPEIDLRQHLEWRQVDVDSLDAYDAEVARTQGWLHNQFFEAIETRPPWKVLCLRPGKEAVAKAVTASPDGFVDVFFAFHHSIADGSGGREFHQHLLAALQSQSSPVAESEVEYTLSFPEAPRLPESQEEAVAFRNGYLFLLRTVWDMIAPAFLKPRKAPIWGGPDVDFAFPYVTRVKPITIAGDALQNFLTASREQDNTITTALHGIILASLAKRLPDAQSFASSTPISLRPWIKAPPADSEVKDKLRTCITGHFSTHPPSVLKTLRTGSETDVEATVWQVGKTVKAELKKVTSKLPNDDPAGLLPLVKDFIGYWQQKDGKERGASWEISNIGVLVAPVQADGVDAASGWKHLNAIMSNGAMVAGCAIGTNLISVKGGPLTVTLSWQEDVVSEEVIEGLASDIADFVDKVHKKGISAK